MVSRPFCNCFIVQVQNVSSPFHNLVYGLVHISEIFFPQKGVRFIAVNNGIDSKNQQEADFTPFLNIMNEWSGFCIYLKNLLDKTHWILKPCVFQVDIQDRLCHLHCHQYLEYRDGRV